MDSDNPDLAGGEIVAAFAERIKELRNWLGMSARQMSGALGKSVTQVTMWETGKSEASKEAAAEISSRWFVSLDSLYAMEGTTHLEPSPVLRLAQERVLGHVATMGVMGGSPRDRLLLAHSLLAQQFPSLHLGGWAEWLQLTRQDWDDLAGAGRPVTPVNLRGAAMVLGWYDASTAWELWLQTGYAEELQTYNEKVITEFLQLAALNNVPPHRLRSLWTQK
jgi:transcriptional regulator with XRE-family HTH domain